MFQLKESLVASFSEMPIHTQELCQLDSGIGDGDHGLTIERGFLAARIAIESYTDDDDAGLFLLVGETMIKRMGGAIGPLYGAYWRAFSKALGDGKLTEVNIGSALLSGCEQVMRLGCANVGDKTIVDSMYPCAIAAANSQGDFSTRLSSAAKAAMQGAIDTKDYQAKKGRARFLGEQSIGHIDAGAYSFALFISHWALNVGIMMEGIS